MSFLHKPSALFVLLALLAAAILIGHHTVPPMDRDESRFAQASRQMLDSGDFVTVRFQDELRAKKPAGIYWLQSATAGLLDKDRIASYRLPSLLALLAAVWGTYHLARNLYHHRRALISAAVLGTSLVAFAEGHLAKTDAVLMALCLGQQMALMKIYLAPFLRRAPPRHGWIWFWLFMGAGIMVKGPIAPALALSTILALCLWDRSYKWLHNLRVTRGLLILGAMTLPWAILVTLATEGAFLDTAIKGDFLAKVESGQESHGAPIGSYLVLAGLLLWPGGMLLPRAMAQLPSLLMHAQSRFLLAWVVPFWLLIEVIPTKLPHYPLPVFPALAVILVCAIDIVPSPIKATRQLGLRIGRILLLLGDYLMAGLSFLLAGFTLWVAVTFGGKSLAFALVFAAIAMAAIGVVIWQNVVWLRGGGIRAVAFALLAGAIFHVTFFAGVLPTLARVHVSTSIDQTLKEMNLKPAAIAASGFHEPSLIFLRGRDVLLVDGGEAALFLAEAPGGLALVEARQNEAFQDMARKLGLALLPPVQIEGYNISKGQGVLILMYQTEPE